MDKVLLALHILFVLLLCGIAVWDIRSRLIDRRLVIALLAVALLKILLEIVDHGMYLTYLWSGLIAGGVTGAVFYAIYRLSGGLGLGDVKLMGAVGLFYGIRDIFFIVMVSMLLVAVAGIAMIVRNRKNLKATLPFAPFVALAAVLRQILVLAQRA